MQPYPSRIQTSTPYHSQLTTGTDIDAETLLALDAQRRPPVTGHLRRLASIMMLDKAVLYKAETVEKDGVFTITVSAR